MLRVLSSMTVAAIRAGFDTATCALILYANAVAFHGIDAIDPNRGRSSGTARKARATGVA